MRMISINKIPVMILLFILILLFSGEGLLAWKSKAHVYLAMLAREDAIDDGKITLYEMDCDRGLIRKEPDGRLKVLGVYPVDPAILTAIRQYPGQYKAGALGPDAFPDLLTGQTGIHADNQPMGFSVSDNWMSALWNISRKQGSTKIKSFVTGFMTHFAGDLYGHHFVNRYSGGPFELGENALKHIVLESYFDQRVPEYGDDFYCFNIDGVNDFIYRVLVTGDLIPPADGGQISGQPAGFFNYAPPRIFKSIHQMVTLMRNAVKNKRANFNAKQNERLRQARAVFKSDPEKSARLTAEAAGLKAESEVLRVVDRYLKDWQDDIVSGQKAWPQFGADFAAAAIFNPNGIDRDSVSSICQDFTNRHLISMLGFPDMVGESMAVAKAFSDLADRFIPGWLKELMTFMRTDLEIYLLKKAWGVALDVLKRPEVHFDPVMNNRLTSNRGERISLRDFNRNVLKISDNGFDTGEKVDWQRIPAMCNSLTMMKLLMLNRQGVDMLISDLEQKGYTSNTLEPLLSPGNEDIPLIIGFMQSLDGSSQWCRGRKMLFARDGCAYRRLFLPQDYEGEPGCTDSCEDPPDWSVTTIPEEKKLSICTGGVVFKKGNDVWWWNLSKGGSLFAIKETVPYKMPAGVLPKLAAVYARNTYVTHGRFAAIGRDGSVWLWGIDGHNLYGLKNENNELPLKVPNLESITAAAMGTYFLLALRSNGTVWSCGSNANVELGQGPGWHYERWPRRVRGLKNIVSIAAGYKHGLAADAEGNVYSWGSNSKGQLGTGPGGNRNLAARVNGIDHVRQVAAGAFHSLALKKDGTVWAWGWNRYHLLADGTETNRSHPVQIRGLSNVKLLAGGYIFSAALTGNGEVFVWGDNLSRVRGKAGSPRFMDTPLKVVGIPPMKDIAAGTGIMMGVDMNGRLWIWGGLKSSPERLPELE